MLITYVSSYDGELIDLNTEYIESLRDKGDKTLITMKSGDKYLVRGTHDQIKCAVNRVHDMK